MFRIQLVQRLEIKRDAIACLNTCFIIGSPSSVSSLDFEFTV